MSVSLPSNQEHIQLCWTGSDGVTVQSISVVSSNLIVLIQ